MSINAILAMGNNMGIGYENTLPWSHNKKDMILSIQGKLKLSYWRKA